jgi:hypothetical protein
MPKNAISMNQQTMFSPEAPALCKSRKADLCDIRTALKSKGIVRQYGDRWNVC